MTDTGSTGPEGPVDTALARKVRDLIDVTTQIGPLNYLPEAFAAADEAAIEAATAALRRYVADRARA